MREYIIVFFCFFIHPSVNSQPITISTFEKQVVYTNIKNPLKISASNIRPENLVLETSNGVIAIDNNTYFWTPSKDENNASLLVYDKGNRSVVDTFKFTVSSAGTPDITWKEKMWHSGYPDWRRITKLHLKMPDCCNHLKLDTLCKILSFDLLITYPKTNSKILIHSDNDSIPNEFKALADSFSPGVKIEFTKIKMYVAWYKPTIFYFDDLFKYSNSRNLSFTLY
jgi:hypothetical protein